MKSLVITIVGKDKPGLIESLAKVVYAHDGNWLASNFSHMAGQFAGFAEIHIPESRENEILAAFEQNPDLNVFLSHGKEEVATNNSTVEVEIVGNDKPGIVQELTATLNQFNLNIHKFDSSCGSAPNWGGTIFKANSKVEIPENFDTDELQSALESIANDLMVEIKLN